MYNSKGQTKLYNSFQKYGIENHSFEVIEECSEENLSEREIHWILYYNAVEKGLNIRIGNRNGSLTKQTKQKISEALKGRKNTWSTSEGQGEKISKGLKEFYKDSKNREKISRGLKTYYDSQDFIPPKPLSYPINIIREIQLKYNNNTISQLSREYNISWGTINNMVKKNNGYEEEKLIYFENNPHSIRSSISIESKNNISKKMKERKNEWTKPKFTKEEQEIIINKFKTQNYTYEQLALEYKISKSTINNIINKKNGYSNNKNIKNNKEGLVI
jgi:Mor family transcriptional regulator